MKSELIFCQSFTILHYYTAAEYCIAVIEYNVLTRSYRSYPFIKHYFDRVVILRVYCARLFGLSVTRLCLASELARGIFKRYPVKIVGVQGIGKQELVTAEGHGIIMGIFSDNIHRLSKACAYASSLPYSIEYNAFVATYHIAVFIEKIPVGVSLACIALDKAGIITVGNEADILTVGLVAVDKPAVGGYAPYLVLGHFTEWENACGKLFLA